LLLRLSEAVGSAYPCAFQSVLPLSASGMNPGCLSEAEMGKLAGNGMHMHIVLALLAFALATCRRNPGMPAIMPMMPLCSGLALEGDLCDPNEEERQEP
jgi:hypothetical protein